MTNPIRILIYSPAYLPKIDGVTRRLQNHLQNLRQMSVSGEVECEVILLCPDYGIKIDTDSTHPFYKWKHQLEPFTMNDQRFLENSISDSRFSVLRLPCIQPARKLAPETYIANPWCFFALLHFLREWEPDVIHFIGPDFFWITACLVVYWLKIKLFFQKNWRRVKRVLSRRSISLPSRYPVKILSYHQHMEQWINEQPLLTEFEKFWYHVGNRIMIYFVNWSDCAIVPSEMMSKYLVSRLRNFTIYPTKQPMQSLENGKNQVSNCGDRVDASWTCQIANSLYVWPPAIDHELFSPKWCRYPMSNETSWISLRKQWTFGGNVQAPVLLYVGRLAAEKRLWVLIEMMKYFRAHLLPENCPYLVLIGKGPLSEQFRNLHGPENRIFATNAFWDYPLLQCAYAAADIFVFPSEFETLGNVCLESMASGCVTVARAAGGVVDMVHDSWPCDTEMQTGILIRDSSVDSFTLGVFRLLQSRSSWLEKLKTREWDKLDLIDHAKAEQLCRDQHLYARLLCNGITYANSQERSWRHATERVYEIYLRERSRLRRSLKLSPDL